MRCWSVQNWAGADIALLNVTIVGMPGAKRSNESANDGYRGSGVH